MSISNRNLHETRGDSVGKRLYLTNNQWVARFLLKAMTTEETHLYTGNALPSAHELRLNVERSMG